MGAAASVQLVYHEAVLWFKQYIDEETFLRDFKEIDKDGDGGVGYVDLMKWIENKASSEGGSWSIFKLNMPAVMAAHKMACADNKDNQSVNKVIKITGFRSLLINLFAISILWVHFDNANADEDRDMANKQLSKEHFAKACHTLAAGHAHENLTSEQIDNDFSLLDIHGKGTVGFMEVCKHCIKFLEETSNVKHVPKALALDVMTDLHSGPKLYFEGADVAEKNKRAVDALAAAINMNISIVNAENIGCPVAIDSNPQFITDSENLVESQPSVKIVERTSMNIDVKSQKISQIQINTSSVSPRISNVLSHQSTPRARTPGHIAPFSPKVASSTHNSVKSSKAPLDPPILETASE